MSKKRCLKRQRTESTEEEMPAKSPFSSEWKKSDAVLVVEGRKLHVHSLVLSLQSPVFEAMFTSGFAESSTKEVSLPGKDLKTVENLLKMIYPQLSLNLWEISPEKIDGVLSLTREYMVDSVRKTVQEFLGYFIERELKQHFENRFLIDEQIDNKDKTVKMLIIADKYNFHDVICKGAKYISAKFEYYCGTDEDSTVIEAVGDYKFKGKSALMLMANMIRKHVKLIKRYSEYCKICKESWYVMDRLKKLIDIDKMAECLITHNT